MKEKAYRKKKRNSTQEKRMKEKAYRKKERVGRKG